jgi:predicted PurR-regulated permease PerM
LNSKSDALKALIQASTFGLVALVVLLILNAAQVLLLIFGGILFAVLLRGMTDWVSRKTALRDGLSLTVSIVVPLTVLGITVRLAAPEVSDQAAKLGDRLPQAAQQLKEQLLQHGWAEQLSNRKERLAQALPSGPSGTSVVPSFFTTTFGALGNSEVVLFLAFFWRSARTGTSTASYACFRCRGVNAPAQCWKRRATRLVAG